MLRISLVACMFRYREITAATCGCVFVSIGNGKRDTFFRGRSRDLLTREWIHDCRGSISTCVKPHDFSHRPPVVGLCSWHMYVGTNDLHLIPDFQTDVFIFGIIYRH